MSIYDYVHGGQAVPIKTKRVFLQSGTAYEGFAVCYKVNAVNVTAENEAMVTASKAYGSGAWCDARRLLVAAPDHTNAIHFAGVVAKESHEVVGPNWITIHTPGSVCKIYSLSSGASAGAGITATDPIHSSFTTTANIARVLTYTIACNSTANTYISSYNGAFVYAGYPGEGSVKCMEQTTAYHGGDTTWDSKCLVMAELMTGQPSGGVQLVAWGSSISSAVLSVDDSHDWARVLTPIGISVLTVAATKPTSTAYGFISIGAGTFIGQKKGFYVPVVAAGTAPALAYVKMVVGASTVAAVRGTTVTSVIAFGSVAGDFVEIEWLGSYWYVKALCSSATTVPVIGN